MQMTTDEKAEEQTGKKTAKDTEKNTGKKAGKTIRNKTGKAGITPLTIWSADAEASAALVQMLAASQMDALPAPEDIETGAQAPEMLLLCASPVRFLYHEMSQGTAPGAALQSWVAQARAVLAVNRRNRRRVHIVDITQALRDPSPVLARFGTGAGTGVDAESEASPEKPTDPVLVLLAQRCLDGDASARALAGELEAVMAGSGGATGDDPDAVFKAAFLAWRDAGWASEEVGLLRTQMSLMLEDTELVQAQGRAAEVEMQGLSENALLLEQRLAQMSEGMASYQAQLDQHEGEKARMTGKLGEKEAALSAAGEMMRELEVQANELNAALSQTEGELSQTRTALGAVEADRDGILHHRDGLQGRVHDLETSLSYRVTAPLRALRALFSNKG